MIDYLSQIRKIAFENPRLAYWLLKNKPKIPQTYFMEAVFSSGAAESTATASFTSPVTSDFWVYDMAYQVALPNAYPGLIGRADYVYKNALNPSIYASLTVRGGVPLPWVMSDSLAPIEQICRATTGPGPDSRYGCCNDFVMTFPQTVTGRFVNKRVLTDDDGPMVVTVAFTGLVLGVQNYGSITDEEARRIIFDDFKINCDAPIPV